MEIFIKDRHLKIARNSHPACLLFIVPPVYEVYRGYIVFVFSVSMCVCFCKLFWRKFFVTLFSGTERPTKLKLGTHVDSGQMYRVYQNQAASAYSSLYFFIFLSNFQN